MGGVALRENITFCRVGDDLIFLDLTCDRYFSLAPAAARAFADLIDGKLVVSPQLAAMFSSGDLMSISDSCFPAPCQYESARSQIPDVEIAVSLTDTLNVLARRIVWRTRLRIFTLSRLVGQFRIDKLTRSSRECEDDDVTRLRAAYRRAALVVSAKDQCLAISLAAAWQLVGMGCRPDLVLGVKLHPFEAHCWVQVGGKLVLDDLDTVRLFTPILVA